MEEKNETIDISLTAKVQGEAPTPQRVGSSTLPAPPVQITAQIAQQVATFFQQMTDNLSAQAQVQTQPHKGNVK